ncbi:hypothetical protein IC229_17335 [Spirosoma sp. BT702]|uniref:Uncharacterized protein n=1 Tax=Spirosoma profusum TaxID=2771354 RepID=A0A927ARK9_9BACT|nr:hypothetical protein [Spirosoma profusum]MBD2702416.1 hypothetical protein [Spirosoma profusum]
MEKKRRITFYNDLNGPHEDQVRENARMTPEERWAVFQRLKRRHHGMFGKHQKQGRRIILEKPLWI